MVFEDKEEIRISCISKEWGGGVRLVFFGMFFFFIVVIKVRVGGFFFRDRFGFEF